MPGFAAPRGKNRRGVAERGVAFRCIRRLSRRRSRSRAVVDEAAAADVVRGQPGQLVDERLAAAGSRRGPWGWCWSASPRPRCPGPRPSAAPGACASVADEDRGRQAVLPEDRADRLERLERGAALVLAEDRVRRDAVRDRPGSGRRRLGGAVRRAACRRSRSGTARGSSWYRATACSSRASNTPPGVPLNWAAPSTTIASAVAALVARALGVDPVGRVAEQRDRRDQAGHATWTTVRSASGGRSRQAGRGAKAVRMRRRCGPRLSGRGTSCTSARSRTSTCRCGRSSRRSACSPGRACWPAPRGATRPRPARPAPAPAPAVSRRTSRARRPETPGPEAPAAPAAADVRRRARARAAASRLPGPGHRERARPAAAGWRCDR